MPRAKKLTAKRVLEALDYNPETGTLTWKINTAKWDQVGKEAGPKVGHHGYRIVSLDKGDYLAQRLAWTIMTGEIPDHPVTFKDGNRLNLKWDNLAAKIIKHKSKFDHSTPEGRSIYMKVWRSENPEKYREKSLKQDFGIDLQEYQRMFVEQNGVCAICQRPETSKRNGKAKWLAVDHCHETNDIRGLLCSKCNVGLGCFSDKIETIISAASYLKKHAERKTKTNIIKLKSKES